MRITLLRLLIFSLLSVILGIAVVTGCGPALPVGTNLVVGDVTLLPTPGATGTFSISVTDMPNGGLAALQIGPGSLRFDPNVLKVTKIEGQNGFEVLAEKIDNQQGTVELIAVNPVEGLVDGTVVTFTVELIALRPGDSAITLDQDALVLGDAQNAEITDYSVINGEVKLPIDMNE